MSNIICTYNNAFIIKYCDTNQYYQHVFYPFQLIQFLRLLLCTNYTCRNLSSVPSTLAECHKFLKVYFHFTFSHSLLSNLLFFLPFLQKGVDLVEVFFHSFSFRSASFLCNYILSVSHCACLIAALVHCFTSPYIVAMLNSYTPWMVMSYNECRHA